MDVSRLRSVSLERLKEVFPDYQRRAGEDQAEESFLKDVDKGVLWKLGDGFAVTSIKQDEQGAPGIFVDHIYIRRNGDIKEFDRKLTTYGKSLGLKWVGCYTRRDPAALLRKVKNGWKLDSYVLRRPIE